MHVFNLLLLPVLTLFGASTMAGIIAPPPQPPPPLHELIQELEGDYSGYTAQDDEIGPRFGFSVAMYNDTLAAGAPNARSFPTGTPTGVVFVFRLKNGHWQLDQRIDHTFSKVRECGYSVALDAFNYFREDGEWVLNEVEPFYSAAMPEPSALGSSLAGSSWQIGDDLTVGGHQNAEAALTIAEGAVVTVEGAVAVADVNTGTGCACRLRVNGTLLADDGNVIHEGGWLGGAGGIGEDTTTIAGTVAPGDPVGTLSASELFFESSAVLEFELDEPGGAGDRISVAGPPGGLTLDGTLQVSDLGGFGEGTYTLIEYTGMLQDNTLAIGSLPSGFTATVDTSTAGEVYLVVTQPPDDVFADRFEQ